MHPGLAALAEEPAAAGFVSKLIGRVKTLFGSTEQTRLLIGKLSILARAFISPTSFSKPADRSECLQRVRGNFSHFRNIYGLIFIAVAIYTVLSSPLLLCGLLILASAWLYSFVLTPQEEPLTVAGFQLRRREKLIVLVPFSILVVTFSGMINSLVYILILTSFIAVPHAAFHELHELDALDQLELEGLKFNAGP